jgi:hypothetical protein
MRVLLDEDVASQALEPLQRVLRGHDVSHVHTLGWSSKKDLFVLRDAAAQGFQVLVTNDARQLDDPDETDAIKRSGLHHVRYGQRFDLGLSGLALALGALIAAMPLVMADLAQVAGQRLVRINGLDPQRRHEVVDPTKAPPKYWPR